MLVVNWSVVRVGVELIGLSLLLSLLTLFWRRKRPGTRTWRTRTHWEWLPFMFGVTVIAAELPRLLGASGPETSIADTIGHVLALTAVLIFFRAIILVVVRAIRLVVRALRRGTGEASR